MRRGGTATTETQVDPEPAPIPVSPQVKRRRPGVRTLAAAATILALLLLGRWGIDFLRDPAAPCRFRLALYDRLGLHAAAENLRAYGLSAIWGKLMILVSALAIGVGGALGLYLAANAIVDRLGE